jgi:hypothetical protein
MRFGASASDDPAGTPSLARRARTSRECPRGIQRTATADGDLLRHATGDRDAENSPASGPLHDPGLRMAGRAKSVEWRVTNNRGQRAAGTSFTRAARNIPQGCRCSVRVTGGFGLE